MSCASRLMRFGVHPHSKRGNKRCNLQDTSPAATGRLQAASLRGSLCPIRPSIIPGGFPISQCLTSGTHAATCRSVSLACYSCYICAETYASLFFRRCMPTGDKGSSGALPGSHLREAGAHPKCCHSNGQFRRHSPLPPSCCCGCSGNCVPCLVLSLREQDIIILLNKSAFVEMVMNQSVQALSQSAQILHTICSLIGILTRLHLPCFDFTQSLQFTHGSL